MIIGDTPAAILKSAFMALFFCFLTASAADADVTFETAPLMIISSNGTIHRFKVELAVDSNQRAQGLMNRHHMGSDRGMLFDFGETRQVMMWMKNTYLSLDMLFIADDGRIVTIRQNAQPQSEAIIDSRVPVAFVLELNAGTVARLGIQTGDVVDNIRIGGK